VALIQFIVLNRKGKWAVKSADQERSFAAQREALRHRLSEWRNG